MPKNLNAATQLAAQGHIADEIVTGEAVALELPSATAFSRIVSGAIDYFVYIMMLFGTLYLIQNADLAPKDSLTNSFIILLLAAYIWILPATIAAFTRGSSIGKLLLRIRIVSLDGGTITARQAFIRSLIAIFEVWMSLGMVASITVFVSRRAQRLGDMLAGTYVVRWPKRSLPEPKPVMPQSLEKWAEIVQTAELPAGLSLNIMNHFKSAKKLTAGSRQEQAKALAAMAEQYVFPPAPWGTPSEDFLAALVLIRFKVETENNERNMRAQQKLISGVQNLKY